MVKVFWDMKLLIIIDFLEKGEIINGTSHANSLGKIYLIERCI